MRNNPLSLLIVLAMTGCAGQQMGSVPVEDRSQGALVQSSPVYPDTPSNTEVKSQAAPAAFIPYTAPAVTMPPSVQTPAPDRSDHRPSRGLQPLTLPSSSPAAPSSAAVIALLQQAQQARAESPEQALAYLERAQRIAPRDPAVYLQLARLRMAQHDNIRAEQLAKRGLSLAAGNPAMESVFKGLLRELGR